MKKKEIDQFLDTHRYRRLSAAELMYTFIKNPEWLKTQEENYKKDTPSEEDQKMEEIIRQAASAEELVNLMRKSISGPNKELLRGRLLEREEEVLPLVKEKSMRNGQDHFIENAMFFLIYCKENTSSWILENYSQFRSEYLKSLFCLVLGFRAGQEVLPFLITEAKRFEELYPNEYYDQGPTWAVRELYDRFYA